MLGWRRRVAMVACCLTVTACTTVDGLFFVRNREADMPVWVRGNTAAGTILLFIHGGPGHNSFTNTTKDPFHTLEADHGVAYWEQRAAGSSRGNATPDSLTLSQYVADLDGVVESLKQRYPGKRLVLLGYSWGGAVGTAYLADPARQAKVAGWIELDGSHDIVNGDRLSREWAMAQIETRLASGTDTAKWQQARDFYRQTPTLTVESFPTHLQLVADLETLLVPDTSSGVTPGLIFFSPFAGFDTTANQSYSVRNLVLTPAFLAIDLSGDLPKITLPSLILWGEHDGRLPKALATEALAKLGTPAARKSLTIFAHSSHTAYATEPDAFVQAVTTFLRGL